MGFDPEPELRIADLLVERWVSSYRITSSYMMHKAKSSTEGCLDGDSKGDKGRF